MSSYFEYSWNKALDQISYIIKEQEKIVDHRIYTEDTLYKALDSYNFSLIDEAYLFIKIAKEEELDYSITVDVLIKNLETLIPLFYPMNEEKFKAHIYSLQESSLRIIIGHLYYLKKREDEIFLLHEEISLTKNKNTILEKIANEKVLAVSKPKKTSSASQEKETTKSNNHSSSHENEYNDYDADYCDYNSPGYHSYWLNN